ncbi:MAG: hypothetical protein WD648_08240 [Planctomycetaceae bacterium]
MAAANKPTGVHVSLIVFVMATIIFAVMWYIEMGERKNAVTAKITADREAGSEKALKERYQQEVEAIRKKVGIDVEDVGLADPNKPNTVMKGMQDAITTYGKNLGKATLISTLAEMSSHINALMQQRNDLEAKLNDANLKISSLQGQFQVENDQFSGAAEQSASDLRQQITAFDETVKDRNQNIAALEKQLRDERIVSENDRSRLTKEIERINKDMKGLADANDRLQRLYDEATMLSFEVADGEIRWVDHASKLVWVNLGEADQLTKGTTFSVYTKAHHGVARGNEDIKGSVEVTRVIGPHLAEGRMLSGDNLRPIAIGDPIYTPLWSPGKVEYFAFIGTIDFDGDGHSDRLRLHELVATANAKVETEVDDQGNMNGPGVTVRTTFLVIGEIPDPLKAPPSELDAINKIMEHNKQLELQARQQGVRVVSLNNFLNYIGYSASRRLWAPGEVYPLKSGQKKLGIDETIPLRQGSGLSGGVYGRTKRSLPAPTSGQPGQKFEDKPSSGAPANKPGTPPAEATPKK